MRPPIFSFFLQLLPALVLTSCAAPTPKHQAFPQLDKAVQAQVKAGAQVVYPALEHSVKPTYPDLPANGSVWAVMHVSGTGKVREVKTVGESPRLYQSAIHEALMQWRFRPGTINGQAVEFPMQVKITFASGKDPQKIADAKAKDGLVFSLNDWVIQSTFPELTQALLQQRRQGKKIAPPVMTLKARLIHPDPTKTGTIMTAFIVDEKGRPKNIHILGEDVPEAFQETISQGILNAGFRPATVEGRPHSYPVALPFKFVTRGTR